jgi:hypothetical protein
MKRLLSVIASAILAVVGLLALMPSTARAGTIIITNCTSAGVNAAIGNANDGDVLVFACTPLAKTIGITNTLVITKQLTINGGTFITLSGGTNTRIIDINGGGTLTLTNIRLVDGQAVTGGGVRVQQGTALVSNTTFIRNVATDSSLATFGGAINNRGVLRVVNSHFFTNSVDSQGHVNGSGGAIASNGILTVEDSVFSGNVADFNGGAVNQFSIGRLDIRGSTFVSKSARFGGAINTFATATITSNLFIHNDADTGGAIVATTFNFPPVLIAQSTFFSNTAQRGGGFYAFSHTSLDNLTFRGNRALGANGGGAVGNQAEVSLSNSVFVTNSTASAGGAISNQGVLTISDSSLMSNTAVLAGGAISNTGLLIVSSSVFTGNATTTSNGQGGAIVNALTGTLDVDYSSFVFNRSSAGGAIAVSGGANADVARSAIVSNSASVGSGGGGGGILNNGLLTVTNSTLTQNFSVFNGAAIFNGGGSATTVILNSTIVSNSVTGGGALRNTGLAPTSTLTIKSTIVAGNTSANCQGQITNGGHNLQFGDLSCGGAILNGNPLLGPLALNSGPTLNFALLPGSPAINAGDNAGCPSTDQRGIPRPQGPVCDSGAFEFVEATLRVFLPIIIR